MSSPRLYLISQNGEILGHFTEAQALEGIEKGFLQLQDQGWAAGMSQWKALDVLFSGRPEEETAREAETAAGFASRDSKTLVSPGTAYRCLLNVGMDSGASNPPDIKAGTQSIRKEPEGKKRDSIPGNGQERVPLPLPTPAPESLLPDGPPPPLPASYLPKEDSSFVPVHHRKKKHGLLMMLAILVTAAAGAWAWQRQQPQKAQDAWKTVSSWIEEAKLYLPPLQLPGEAE